MKKFTLFAASMLMAGAAFAADDYGYWYIRGTFNEFNPNGDTAWAVMDDDTGEANVYTGTFEVPAGAFKFNLMNSEDLVFVPLDTEDFEYMNVSLNLADVHSYIGTAGAAWDDYDESYYWSCDNWPGGLITVSINASENNPTIESYSVPVRNDYNANYTLTELNEEGVITIYWDGAIDDVWFEEGNAYIVDENGNETILAKAIPGQEGQVTLCDSAPYGLSIDITSLELAAGDYTLVIPAKYIQIVSDDWDTWLYNPEIRYEFSVSGTTGIDVIGSANGEVNVYNLQGVKVNVDNIGSGLYIINGKKVLIRK